MSAQELAKGKWDLEKTENFDEYMKALGVGMATRLIANKLKPSIEISIADDSTWCVKSISTFKSTEVKFKLGEQFDEVTPDGRNVKTTFTVDGSKLIQDQIGDPPSKAVRDFTQDNFTLTLTAKDVTCTRVYKRSA